MKPPQLRLYTFCNVYLSSIQQGIQSAHVVHSLFTKYRFQENGTLLWDWALHHKTMIVLNGGPHQAIKDGYDLLEESRLRDDFHYLQELPYEKFSEDDLSLGGIMTSFGVVVPDYFYDAKLDEHTGSFIYEREFGDRTIFRPGTDRDRFIEFLKNCSLAR